MNERLKTAIALLVIAAIAYGVWFFFIGVPAIDYIPEHCMVEGGISCNDSIYRTDLDSLEFRLINGIGSEIEITTVVFTSDDIHPDKNGACTNSTGVRIPNGAYADVALANCPMREGINKVRGNVRISYENASGTYEVTGEVLTNTWDGTPRERS